MGLVDLSSLLVQAVNIAVIVFVLRKFVFLPYLKHIDTEVAKRQELETKTADADIIIQTAQKQAEAQIEAAKQEANEIRKNARDLAKRETSLSLSAAADEAQAIKNKALGEIEAEKLSLESEMRGKILSVAIALNTKLFGDSKKNAELLEQFAKQL